MKLKYYLNSKGEKIYTLKDKVGSTIAQDAHYKFIKLRSENEIRKASADSQDSE